MEPHSVGNLTYAEGKKPDQKRVHPEVFHLYKISENTNYSDKKQICGCLYKGRGGTGGKRWEIWGANGYVHHLDCGDGFTGVYTSELLREGSRRQRSKTSHSPSPTNTSKKHIYM